MAGNLAFSGLYWLADRVRGRENLKYTALVREMDKWCPEQIADWQLSQIKRLLRHAYANVPFYSKRLQDIGFEPGDFRTLQDLQLIPVLTKADIQANFEELKATNLSPDRFVPGRTGGSTGEPTRFYYDKQGRNWEQAIFWMNSAAYGRHLGTKTAKLSGNAYDISLSGTMLGYLRSFLFRQDSYPVAIANDAVFDTYYSRMSRFRPEVLTGYASGIFMFADYLIRTGKRIPSVKSVSTTAENLYPHQRARIEEAFNCEVFDAYGGREFFIAQECRVHTGMHVNWQTTYVELLAGQCVVSPGEVGRVIVTYLHNDVFPFIRYDIGDLARWDQGTCSCGRMGPRFKDVVGRVSGVVVTPEGKVATQPNFTLILSSVTGITKYQIRQDKVNHVDLLIVPGVDWDAARRDKVQKHMSDLLGPSVHVAIREVGEIPRPESGKERVVISPVGDRFFAGHN